MRNKVILIRAFAHISPEITSAAFERMNADHILIMTALRWPQYMPDPWNKFTISTTSCVLNTKPILEHLRSEGNEHCLLAQYADIATERGLDSIRVVEGEVLRIDWFYETVKNYHKAYGQTVCVCELSLGDDIMFKIDDVLFTRNELIERLGQSDILD